VKVLCSGDGVVAGSVYKLYIFRGVFDINNVFTPPSLRSAVNVVNVFVTVESSYRLRRFVALFAILVKIFAIN
jgi:hypothetical protein